MPFGKVETLVVGSDRYYTGIADDYEIEERTLNGRLLRLIRIDLSQELIDSDRRDAFITEKVEGMSEVARSLEEPALRAISTAIPAPAYTQLLLDDRGRLWVRGFGYETEPQVWHLLDRRGRWLGDVETPPGIDVLEVGGDYVLGRATDALDVHSILLFALIDAVEGN